MKILGTEEIGQLLGIKAATVLKYLHWCAPGGRYESHPFPAPSGVVSGTYYWTEDRVPEIVKWNLARSGSGYRSDLKKDKQMNFSSMRATLNEMLAILGTDGAPANYDTAKLQWSQLFGRTTMLRDAVDAELAKPLSWEFPTEPPATVTRLRCDCHPGKTWVAAYKSPVSAWQEAGDESTSESALHSFVGLLSEHGKLYDATDIGDPS